MTQELTPKGTIITGYKATDENMKCRGFQFELGKWYEHDGDLKLCGAGFHFCEYPSGPWAYYDTGRMFKCEAEIVLKSTGPGAELKHVARRIRLIEEIVMDGDGNTGNWNTGNRNTGDGNVGAFHSGSLNKKEAPLYMFDIKTKVSRGDVNWSVVGELCLLLSKDEPFDTAPFLSLPNATSKRIKDLHMAHIAFRKGE